MRHFSTKDLKNSSQYPERGYEHDNGGRLRVHKHLMSLIVSFLVLGLVLVPFTNCASEHGVAPLYSGPSLAEILASIQSQKNTLFRTNCATCHNQAATDPNIVTRDLFDTAALEADGVIILGQPQNSELYLYLVDEVHDPALEVEVSQSQLNLIRDWIAVEGGEFDTVIDPGGGGPLPPAAVTIADIRAILVNRGCVNCHANNPNAPAFTANITAAQLQALRVPNTNPRSPGARVVEPFNLANSRLFQVIDLQIMPAGNPLGANSSEEVTIRSWIQGGAL
jgi:hypothetical protein